MHDWQGKTILIVEDEEVNNYFFQVALDETNATLLFAKSGKEAVDYVSSNQKIDAILMDIRMPEMNGYEATREIKRMRPGVPIIAQTAYAMNNEREKILETGCDDYLSKPIRYELLMSVLSRFLDN